MSKRLRAAIKECRETLEKDFVVQVHDKKSGNIQDTSVDQTNQVREKALAFFLTLAGLRCFEEQIWKIPPQLSISSEYEEVFEKLTSFYKILQSEICYPLNAQDFSGLILSTFTRKTVLHHLIETISPEEWQSENILGWIYQYFYDETAEQKQHGRFYTPEPISEYIVSQAFDLSISKRKALRLHPGQAASEGQNAIAPFTVLDLGCGSGVFALRAFDYLYKLYAQDGLHLPDGRHLEGEAHLINIPQHILASHLFLVDNDPWACQLAAINLYLKAKRVEPACYIRKMNIFCADALQRWEDLSPSNTIKKIFTRQYDLVVGNPPYIVINQLRTSKGLIRLYKSYHSAAFKINTFPLFIERGIGLLKPGGILGMIVPNTLLTQVYFEPLRQYILQTSKILRILDTKRMFDNAFVENCILLLQREIEVSERSGQMIECVTTSSNENRKKVHVPASLPLIQSAGRIAQHHFERAPFNMFQVHLNERLFALIEKIARGHPKLGEICESHDGVNPGNAKHKLIVSKKLDKTCKKVLNGKNIGRYWLKWGGLYVRYNKALLTKDDNVRWGHKPSLDAAKILSRQTADRIIATFDTGAYYTTNSIHTTILQDGNQGFYLKYLLGLLNSKLISFYYRKLFPENGQLFSQVKLINLRQLPLKQASKQDQQYVIDLVDTLLQEASLLNSPPGRGRGGSFSNCQLSINPLQEMDDLLDQKIYELYQLSSDEIQLIEQEMGSSLCLYPKVSV